MTPPDDPRDDVAVARLRPVLFDLWLPRGPELSWEVLSLRGTEALAQPYEFEVELWCDDPDADFEQVLGADCELLLDRNGLERRIYGIIAEIEVLFAAQLRIERDGIGARVKVVPAFRLLEHEVDTRFFAGQTVIEILAELLGSRLAAYERKLDVESRIKGEYNRRDYCVQFRESTSDFCSRIMQEEGIAYVFVPDDDEQRESMVLVDGNEDYAAVELLVPECVPIERDRPEELDRESLQALHWRHKAASNRVFARGYNYKLSNPIDEGEAEELGEARPVVRERVVDAVQRQIIDDPLGDPEATSFDGSGLAQQVPLARRLLEAARVDAAIGRGQSNAVGFAAGVVFELERPLSGGPRTTEFLLTRVVHLGHVSEGAESTRYAYENQFECIARGQAFRPPRTIAKPKVHGVQTGVVVGKDADEVHTDRLGRVRVAFAIQRHREGDEQASCWIRVAQIWAGAGYGAMVIPRVGMEVVVSFVDGDPDRPLVTGCVYNANNLPPYELPEQLSKTTFKTNSTPGGDGFGEVRFEDGEGAEQLFVRAQRRMDLRVQGTWFATCTGSREERIGSSDGAAPSEAVHATTVWGDVHELFQQERRSEILGASFELCAQDMVVATRMSRLVYCEKTHQISAPTVIVEAAETISHAAKHITLVASETLSAMGGGKLVLESNNAIELRVGRNFIALDPAGIDIQGTTLRLNSGGGVGNASEALVAEPSEGKQPYEALPADDGRIHKRGGSGGGGQSRERGSWELEPHRPPPVRPPPQPRPDDPVVPYDMGSGPWLSMKWKHEEVWCSGDAALIFEARDPGPSDRGTAYVQDAMDGTVVAAQGVFARDGVFEQPVDLRNILPRETGEGVEDSRELSAWLTVGLSTDEDDTTVLRFLSNLPRMYYADERARFFVEIRDHVVRVGSNIPYVRGRMGYLISLGDLAPDDAGPVAGTRVDGFDDWRYCKKSPTDDDPDALVFWNGERWRPVPKEFKNSDPLGTKLIGIGVWAENGAVKTQYGKMAWPEASLPEWSEKSLAELERAKARWIERINRFWSGHFDLKREQCQGHEPRCCRFSIECDVDFFEIDRKVELGIVIGENITRENSSAWSLETSDPVAIHEFGHHLGNPDEYEGASTVNIWTNGDGAVMGIDEDSIMGEKQQRKRRRHLLTVAHAVAQLVEQETGQSFTFTPVEALR